MVCGQGFDAMDGMHNQLRHGSVVVVPTGMIVLTNCIRQIRVRHLRPIKLPLENDQNCIAVAVDVLPCVRPVRHFDESSPEPM
jgi:hypothetical protein